MLDLLKKENKIDEIKELMEKNGLSWLMTESLPLCNKNTYLKIEGLDRISIKEPNFSLVKLLLIDNGKYTIQEYLESVIGAKEKIKKIDRVSGETLEKVKDNYYKVLLKGDTHFALRYGYELFCRDKNEFVKISLAASLVSGWEKCAYSLAFIQLLDKYPQKGITDALVEIYIRFIAAFPSRLERFAESGIDTDDYKAATAAGIIYNSAKALYTEKYNGIVNGRHNATARFSDENYTSNNTIESFAALIK